MGQGARLPGAAQSPLPGLRWKSRCVLYSCIFKVGRWARNRRPRTTLNCKRAFKQLFVEPWTARLEGAARDASARRGPVGQGLEKPGSGPRGPSNPRAWASAPDALLGAPRRGRSRRGGQAAAPPCGGSARPGLLPAPGQAGPSASDLQHAGHSEGAASRLRSWAGPESSDRAGPSRHGGSIIHGAPGRAPKTCSALSFSGEVGRRQGKSSQSKVGHISHFLK